MESDDQYKRDIIKLRDGRSYTVVMTYWHWHALEWITEDTGHPMYQIIDTVNEHLPNFEPDGHNFDYVLAGFIEQYYDSWHNGPMNPNQGSA